MQKDSKIYIAGHTGLAGSAIRNELSNQGYNNLLLMNSLELDLRMQKETEEFLVEEKPDYVFFAAGKVGGLEANNKYRAQFIYDNLQMQNNVIHGSWRAGVYKFLYLGSNCAYPKECPQPMREESFLSGKPEPTNQPFALAKMAGIEMCDAFNRESGTTDFIPVIPASLYGPEDNYKPGQSHIVPTLIRKCHEAKERGEESITISGGKDRRRELMHSYDLAKAAIFLVNESQTKDLTNIGTNIDHSVEEIANLVKETVGYEGEIIFDESKPTGMKRKLLDSNRINCLGWRAEISLEEGLKRTYKCFKSRYPALRRYANS